MYSMIKYEKTFDNYMTIWKKLAIKYKKKKIIIVNLYVTKKYLKAEKRI